MKKFLIVAVLLTLSVPSTSSAACCGRHMHPLRTAARVFWRTSPFYVFGHHCR